MPHTHDDFDDIKNDELENEGESAQDTRTEMTAPPKIISQNETAQPPPPEEEAVEIEIDEQPAIEDPRNEPTTYDSRCTADGKHRARCGCKGVARLHPIGHALT